MTDQNISLDNIMKRYSMTTTNYSYQMQ